MIAQTQIQKDKLIREVWGDCCIECDYKKSPVVHLYKLKSEDVAVITCPKCDFTIVVIEIENLYKETLKDEINDQENTIVTTYSTT